MGLVTWRCHVVVVVGVVGDGGDEVVVADGGGLGRKHVHICLFTCEFPANAAHAAHSCLHVLLHNNCQTLLSVLSLYIRQALDPHLRHGPRKLGRASGAGHSLPGARPLDPLVLMFNPTSGTHV